MASFSSKVVDAAKPPFNYKTHLSKVEYYDIKSIAVEESGISIYLERDCPIAKHNANIKIVVSQNVAESNNGTYMARVDKFSNNRFTLLRVKREDIRGATTTTDSSGYVMKHRSWLQHPQIRAYIKQYEARSWRYPADGEDVDGKQKKMKLGFTQLGAGPGGSVAAQKRVKLSDEFKMVRISEEKLDAFFSPLIGQHTAVRAKINDDGEKVWGPLPASKDKLRNLINDMIFTYPDFSQKPVKKGKDGQIMGKVPKGQSYWVRNADSVDGVEMYTHRTTGEVSRGKPECLKWRQEGSFRDDLRREDSEVSRYINSDHIYKISRIELEQGYANILGPSEGLISRLRKQYGVSKIKKLESHLRKMDSNIQQKKYIGDSSVYHRHLARMEELWVEVDQRYPSGLSEALDERVDELRNFLTARFICASVPYHRVADLKTGIHPVMILNNESANNNMFIENVTVTQVEEESGETVFEYESPVNVKYRGDNPNFEIALNPCVSQPQEDYPIKLRDYFKYVKNPIGLNQMKEKLTSNSYRANRGYTMFEELVEDIQLVRNNARSYWGSIGDGQETVKYANEMYNNMVQGLKKIQQMDALNGAGHNSSVAPPAKKIKYK